MPSAVPWPSTRWPGRPAAGRGSSSPAEPPLMRARSRPGRDAVMPWGRRESCVGRAMSGSRHRRTRAALARMVPRQRGVDVRESVAIVTGAGSGIGAATAVALAAEGWEVVLAGRRVEALQAVAERGPAGRLHPAPTDVTDETSVRALFDGAVEAHGRVDLLFNNAGRSAAAVDLDALTLAEWQAVVAGEIPRGLPCPPGGLPRPRAPPPPGG